MILIPIVLGFAIVAMGASLGGTAEFSCGCMLCGVVMIAVGTLLVQLGS
jgi:hypothetical protein